MTTRSRSRCVVPGPLALVLGAALLVCAAPALGAGGDTPRNRSPSRAGTTPAVPDPRCESAPTDDATAEALLSDRYRFPPHPTVTLTWPIDWQADPLDDRNWRFQLHALTWLEPLLSRWTVDGDQSALDRASAVAHAWIAGNPRRDPPSAFSWEAHATALRASVLACLAGIVPAPIPAWLTAGLRLHGRVLADPATPVPAGNHALNQAIGLLDVGCRLDRRDWSDLADDRLRRLLTESIDVQGVANEQSIAYQRYVLVRWRVAQERRAACGYPPLPYASRIDRAVRLLAFATQPDGKYLMIGDTLDERADPIPGTIAAFAATAGAEGPRPARTVARFDAGYLLVRTGWGETRPFEDEILIGLRFGPGRFLHGHDDGGSLTLYGHGSRLLLDPGFRDYDRGPWMTWFRSREAHDTVIVDGRPSDALQGTRLVRHVAAGDGIEAVVRVTAMRGIVHTRRVIFSLATGVTVVEDRVRRVAGTRPITARQLWHLAPDADPMRAGSTVWTRQAGGTVTIRQLVAPDGLRMITGRRSPLQGWVAAGWGRVRPAPVVEARQAGRTVRFLTLLVPSAATRPGVSVGALRLTRTGFSFTVQVGGRAERFEADADGAMVTASP